MVYLLYFFSKNEKAETNTSLCSMIQELAEKQNKLKNLLSLQKLIKIGFYSIPLLVRQILGTPVYLTCNNWINLHTHDFSPCEIDVFCAVYFDVSVPRKILYHYKWHLWHTKKIFQHTSVYLFFLCFRCETILLSCLL